MTDTWLVIIGIALMTFTIRISGVLLGQRLPRKGAWSRGLNALPGCLIIALVAVLLLSGSLQEWIAGGLAAFVAILTKNLPVTMVVGILSIFALRQYF